VDRPTKRPKRKAVKTASTRSPPTGKEDSGRRRLDVYEETDSAVELLISASADALEDGRQQDEILSRSISALAYLIDLDSERPLHPDDADAPLMALQDLRNVVAEYERVAVHVAWDAGFTTREIAERLGRSTQAVWKKYGNPQPCKSRKHAARFVRADQIEWD
jgi:hypothetical protein